MSCMEMTVSKCTCCISVLHKGHLESSGLEIFWLQLRQNEECPHGTNLPLEVICSKHITQLFSLSLVLVALAKLAKVSQSVQLKITSRLFPLKDLPKFLCCLLSSAFPFCLNWWLLEKLGGEGAGVEDAFSSVCEALKHECNNTKNTVRTTYYDYPQRIHL